GDSRRGSAQQPQGQEEKQARLPRGWAWSADAVAPDPSLPPPPPPPPQLPFVVGDLVSVDPRTWPGMNKHGGVARICAVLDPPGSAYDVRYSVGRVFDRGVEARFVHAYAFPTETVGIRSRRSSGGGGGGGSNGGSSRSSRHNRGSSRRSVSLGGGSAAVYSPVAPSRSVAASAASSSAAAAAADVAAAATPTGLPSPFRATAGAHRQAAAAAAAVAVAVVGPEIERSPGVTEVAETPRDDAGPAGKEDGDAGSYSRRSDATTPPAALEAGGGVCSSDVGTGVIDGGAAAAVATADGSAGVGEAEGSLIGAAVRTREDEGER
ncbi:unnamed protein product, partial [Laminaria digitata]